MCGQMLAACMLLHSLESRQHPIGTDMIIVLSTGTNVLPVTTAKIELIGKTGANRQKAAIFINRITGPGRALSFTFTAVCVH
jgi:hypothetical protein